MEGQPFDIMPKSTMHDLGITIEELPKTQMMIQGLNLEGQCTFGTIYVELMMSDLSKSSMFYVINTKTSYNLLLGWPSLHKHGSLLQLCTNA